jgi:hypothetical protein
MNELACKSAASGGTTRRNTGVSAAASREDSFAVSSLRDGTRGRRQRRRPRVTRLQFRDSGFRMFRVF